MIDQPEHIPPQILAEFEKALREAAVSLPPGVTTEDAMRGMLEQTQRLARDPKVQARMQVVNEIVRQVSEELPGGQENPDFLKILEQRLPRFDGDAGASA